MAGKRGGGGGQGRGKRAYQPNSGQMEDFREYLAFIHRTKKKMPIVVEMRKADAMLAHQPKRALVLSEIERSVASLHH
jgi:hypothetical protein